jgi:hypothetical protein
MNIQPSSQPRILMMRLVCLQGLNTILGDQGKSTKRVRIGSLIHSLESVKDQLRIEMMVYPRFQNLTEQRKVELIEQERPELMMSLFTITPADNSATQVVGQVLQAQIDEIEVWQLVFRAWIDEEKTHLVTSIHALKEILCPKLEQASKLHVQYEQERTEAGQGDDGNLLFLKAQRVNAHQDESMTLALIDKNLSQLLEA